MSSSSSNSNPKMIVLVSSDGESFEIEEGVVSDMQAIRHMIEDGSASTSIPLPNITSKVLSKILEFCKHHHSNADSDDFKAFNTKFLRVDQNMLFDLVNAAYELDIRSLVDLLCQKIANLLNGMTPEEIRKTFHITNDLTPEEEEEIRSDNAWVYDSDD